MLPQNLRSRVYYITKDETARRGEIVDTVREALRAGVGMVQYRAKDLPTRDMVEEATALSRMTRAARVPLIINDRVDVALAVGAEGVHVGTDDMPVALARRLMGPSAIIGATTPTPEDARLAEHQGATYVAAGAIWASPSKPDKPVLGLEGLARIQAATSLPTCAIGGISKDTIKEAVTHGAELVAVMSAIHDQPDPRAAARELVALAGTFLPPRLPAP